MIPMVQNFLDGVANKPISVDAYCAHFLEWFKKSQQEDMPTEKIRRKKKIYFFQ